MIFLKALSYSTTLLIGLSAATATAQSTMRIKALALGEKGVVEDIKPKDWSIKIGGKVTSVVSQRLPAELGKEGQKWAFVFLPVRDPETRKIAVQSVATFMSTLPATDSALIVIRNSNGLDCLTPGFTTRPSLWKNALGRVIKELPSRLDGNPSLAFTLPTSPEIEKEEDIEPIQAFLRELSTEKVDRRADDVTSKLTSIVDSYSIESLGGYAKTISRTLESIEQMAETISKVQGEKHFIVFSKCEIDDLSNPAWGRKVTQMSSGGLKAMETNEVMASRDVLNSKLQTEMMIRDVTLARISLSAKFAQLGLTLHSVGNPGASFAGAFGEAAQASGGFQFRFDSNFVTRFCQLLPLWATRYELEVALPPEPGSPIKIVVETSRKKVQTYAPSAR
ncbi:MAG: hypothetical protein Q8O00_06830 [Holophaga sp.]|nr:hypothetical protein [Holophaga sp.]